MKDKTETTDLKEKKEGIPQDRSSRIQCIKDAAERHRIKSNVHARYDRPVSGR